MRLAVIVTTYNWPEALALVLAGYGAQTDTRFDLLVADDGSTQDTAEVVAAFARRAPFPVRHVWQRDEGFRAAAIRNRALAHTDAEYVVFTDGDCVPLPGFVLSHKALSEPGYFVSGHRALLSPAFTRKVLANKTPLFSWSLSRWVFHWLRRDINRWMGLVTIPGTWTRRADGWAGVKTCNLGVWRADLVRLNGFEESYEGWGLEDSDLAIRLLRSGCHRRSGRFAAPLLHLWHRENSRTYFERNEARLAMCLESTEIRARRGLNEHGAERLASDIVP
ncbi:glycosyltransferase family 2 protein [Acidiferrobacter sp.]|uniref:glycosyltransferase family 2 protein n=1 Tax=Acidiferrobacter sp. TaxID=1872107 RepID=UPI0026337860|nr:glycosyltransferase family 2 protein [Acidiferrobacter sp.]